EAGRAYWKLFAVSKQGLLGSIRTRRERQKAYERDSIRNTASQDGFPVWKIMGENWEAPGLPEFLGFSNRIVVNGHVRFQQRHKSFDVGQQNMLTRSSISSNPPDYWMWDS
ncbi:hypothetical protein FQN53_005354, partial [Emmonsiellopsis sp. PD_33]